MSQKETLSEQMSSEKSDDGKESPISDQEKGTPAYEAGDERSSSSSQESPNLVGTSTAAASQGDHDSEIELGGDATTTERQFTDPSDPFASLAPDCDLDIDALRRFVEEDVEPRLERYRLQGRWPTNEDYMTDDSSLIAEDILERVTKDYEELFSLIVDMFKYLRSIRSDIDPNDEQRCPFTKLPKHDVRGEMMFFAYEILAQRKLPLWTCQILACTMTEYYKTELGTGHIPYVPGVYEVIHEPREWYRQMIRRVEDYIVEIMDRKKPIPDKPAHWDQYPFSCWAMKNGRRKMEDRNSLFPTLAAVLPNIKDVPADEALFCVFDGHNGADCATYASINFPVTMVEVPDFVTKSQEDIMVETFAKLNERLEVRMRTEEYRSGSTAVCAHIRGKRVCVGWLGDAAAAVMNSVTLEPLTQPHVPLDSDEAQRVTDDGGFLIHVQGELRVNGVLNVTRSLGDLAAGASISSKPSISATDLKENDYALVLGSDGLFDYLEPHEIYAAIRKFVESHDIKDYYSISKAVALEASQEGSTDNITCIVVFLRPVEDLWKLFPPVKKPEEAVAADPQQASTEPQIS